VKKLIFTLLSFLIINLNFSFASEITNQIPWDKLKKEDLNRLLFKAIKKLRYYSTDEILDVLEEAIRRGANVNARFPDSYASCYESKGTTPLHWASYLGNEKIVRFLLNRGADLEAKDEEYGATPLMFAVWRLNDEVVKILIHSGANVNQTDYEGRTPLHYLFLERCSPQKSPLPVLATLLTAGANVNKADKNGRTPIFYLLENRVKWLEV
jgi:hypothetical protein